MKKYFLVMIVTGFIFFSCKKDDEHNHSTADTTFPEVTLNTPLDSSVFQNGDTVFISGSVSDNALHSGSIVLKNDTSLVEYFNQSHNVHGVTSAPINFFYVVTGITQNESVTLSATYEDQLPNTRVVTRKLFFQP